ncbi:MAG: diacylglycerol kinase family protein [Salibacteraceae bacterium]
MSTLEKKQEGLIEGPFLFIVNPNSGTGTVKRFDDIIKNKQRDQAIEVIISQSPQHSIDLARSAASRGYSSVVAVGGDGSVREIGIQLINSDCPLGIIPTGSGNGIARHLGISMQMETAIEQVLNGKKRAIDTLLVNNKPAIGWCGTGIDGEVALAFDNATERGFSNYVKLSLDVLLTYKATPMKVLWNDQSKDFEAYTIVAANTTQYGNNAFINPKGKDDDGLLDLIVIKAMPTFAIMPLASRLFLKSITGSKWVEHIRSEKFTLINQGNAPCQIDGEPVNMEETITFEIVPKSLTIIEP